MREAVCWVPFAGKPALHQRFIRLTPQRPTSLYCHHAVHQCACIIIHVRVTVVASGVILVVVAL